MVKLWRPKDPKAIIVIKLTLWAGLLTWMVCTIILAILLARQVAIGIEPTLSQDPWDRFVGHWLMPIWVVFTTLMLVWAVARFANKRLRGHGKELDAALEEKDVKALAGNRFWRKQSLRVFFGLVVLIGLSILVNWIADVTGVKWLNWLVLGVYVVALFGVWYAVKRNEREYLREWEKLRGQEHLQD